MGTDPAAVDIDIGPERIALRFDGTPYEVESTTELGAPALDHLDALRRDGRPSEYGAELTKCLVRGGVAEGFAEALATIKGGHQAIRMRLLVSGDERLSALWWEGLFDVPFPGTWASITRGTPVSRYQPREGRWVQSIARSTQLKVLAVISNPKNLAQAGDYAGFTPLRQDVEAATLDYALQDLDRVAAQVLTSPASPSAIRTALVDGPRGGSDGYHVLHLVAPAYMDPKDGLAYLLLEDRDESARPFSEVDLTNLIYQVPDLQLVVLSGGHSAQASDGAALVRLAEVLVDSGLPAALAFRDRLPQEPAKIFLSRLYKLIEKSVAKTDWIDSVVNEARNGLHLEVGAERWSWLLPVLYMRGDGRLFDVGPDGGASTVASAFASATPSAPVQDQRPLGGTQLPTSIAAQGAASPSTVTNNYFLKGDQNNAAKEVNVRNIQNSGQANILMDNAHIDTVNQAQVQGGYDPAEMDQLLGGLIEVLRANAASDPQLAPAATQLELAKAQNDAGDPPDAIKARIEKAGDLLSKADDSVKQGLNLAESLGKVAVMVQAAIPWVAAALAAL